MYLIWEQLVFLSLPWIRRSKRCAWKWISEHVLFSGWGWIILYLLPRDSHKQPLQVDEWLFSLGCVREQNKPSWIIRFYGYAVSNNFLKKPNYILLISKPCCTKRRILECTASRLHGGYATRMFVSAGLQDGKRWSPKASYQTFSMWNWEFAFIYPEYRSGP